MCLKPSGDSARGFLTLVAMLEVVGKQMHGRSGGKLPVVAELQFRFRCYRTPSYCA